MKTYRILGFLWFALCFFGCCNFGSFCGIQPTAPFVWFIIALFCLLVFTGLVASIFLFFGKLWPRWIISLLAIVMGFFIIASIVTSGSLGIATCLICAFALATPVLLFLPRHEPVA
jgi:hypothetical protein